MSGFNILILIILAFILLGCGEKPQLASSQLIRGYEITQVKSSKHARLEFTNPSTKHTFSQYLRKRCSQVANVPTDSTYTIRENVWRYADGETDYRYEVQTADGYAAADYFCDSNSPLYHK